MQLWQLYRHDLSEFRGTHGPEGFVGSLPDADGRYHERGLQPFLEPDDDRAGYLFRRHPGTWEIPFQDANAAAARFWRGIGAPDAQEERRPVPGKPEVPPDVWLTLTR